MGLVFVGDGPARSALLQCAAVINPGSIHFAGFAQRELLPAYYALADAFVFPTHTDPWGLVVNEAMACGLPVISSERGRLCCRPGRKRMERSRGFHRMTSVNSLPLWTNSPAMLNYDRSWANAAGNASSNIRPKPGPRHGQCRACRSGDALHE